MGLLEEHYDPDWEPGDHTIDTLIAEHVAQVRQEFAVALVASQIPSRVMDKRPESLALDKKRSRRVAHALAKTLALWDESDNVARLAKDAGVARSAAAMNWAAYWDQKNARMAILMRKVATVATRAGTRQAGNITLNKLRNEQEWVQHALRE